MASKHMLGSSLMPALEGAVTPMSETSFQVHAAELSDKIAEMLRTAFGVLIAELSDRISKQLAPVSEQLHANQATFNKLENEICSLSRQAAEKNDCCFEPKLDLQRWESALDRLWSHLDTTERNEETLMTNLQQVNLTIPASAATFRRAASNGAVDALARAAPLYPQPQEDNDGASKQTLQRPRRREEEQQNHQQQPQQQQAQQQGGKYSNSRQTQQRQRKNEEEEQQQTDDTDDREERSGDDNDTSGDTTKCPCCGTEDAHWDHIMWTCPKRLLGAPTRLQNPLQDRYGWPTTGNNMKDLAILRWMETVVETTWAGRHGESIEHTRQQIAQARRKQAEAATAVRYQYGGGV
mmetsp:Transcript_13199/g.25898  ORF Transcript_13199/g.25898 Transcript_13199/m.25898 type:complete len:352 (-) Transcript_13199:161-1216(-)